MKRSNEDAVKFMDPSQLSGRFNYFSDRNRKPAAMAFYFKRLLQDK